jgi:O-antigen ligase
MFLFMLRLKAPWSWLAGAICLAELAVLQMKGLYIAVPIVIILLGFAAGKTMKPRLWQTLGASMLLGGVLLAMMLPLIPEGRVSKVSLSTFVEQFKGLDGDQNKAGGEAVSDRIKWQTRTWDEQKKSAGDMVWGMGLGRDLTGGFNAGDANVRKPHNDYIEIQARYGFIGLTLWLAFIGSLLVPVWRGAKSARVTREERVFLLWVLATAITALIIAGTQPLLAYPYGTAAIFCTLGMGLALVRQAESRYESDLEAAQWSMALAETKRAS